MPRFLVDLLGQFRSVWARLDAGQRWLMVAVLGLTLVGLGAMMWIAGRPDNQLVLEATDPRELATAVRALTQAGVPFERDGRGIAVPRAMVQQARSVLFESGAGLAGAGGGEGDDLLTRFTLDRDARKDLLDAKNRARAERALLQIEGVQAATVTSSLPKRSVYQSLDAETQPRASVLVRLRFGASFRKIAAAAVDAAAAALGIAPEHVVVVNASTQERYAVDSRSGSTVDSGEFLTLQRARSDELTERAQAVLDRLYPDQARVQVAVDLDPNWELRQEKIVPEAPILVSDKTTKTDSAEAAVGAAGDSGTTAAADAYGPRSTKKDSTTEKSYEPFLGTSSKGKLAPDVRRLSVALVIDERLQLSAEKIASVENLVKQCVGFTADRDGFAVAVEKLPEIAVDLPPSSANIGDVAREYVPTAAQVLGVVLVLWFLRGMLRRAVERPASAPAAVAEAEVPDDKLTPEESLRRMRRDIEKAIVDDPAAVSRMLEAWLTEVKA